MDCIIRSETTSDIRAIHDLTKRAFAPMPFSGGNEQDLNNALRDANALAVSLVAERNAEIVGHVAFTPAFAADGTKGWFGLGPIAVEPSLQRTGIGTTLIKEGFRRLESQNAKGCVVVGDPAYYPRFGFLPAPQFAPPDQPAEYFMMKILDSSAQPCTIHFHPVFSHF